MLEKIDLNKTLDREIYKTELKELEKRLAELQLKVQEFEIPVIITFEGWSAAGKGTLMKKIVYPLDPRLFNVCAMSKVSQEMKMRPFLWAYWNQTPLKGRIAIFDRSWSRNLLPMRAHQWNFSKKEKDWYYYDINAFEKQLSDDGTVIIKLFLHISEEEQRARLKNWGKNPDTKWRVNEQDLGNYKECTDIFEKMIYHTNRAESPWHIVESNDKRFATIKIFKIIINRLEEEIAKKAEAKTRKAEEKETIATVPQTQYSGVSILSSVDLSLSLSEEVYKTKLKMYQAKMSELGNKLYAKRQSVAIVYEGWDAAGKGGNIKRITEDLDPRGYEVVPTPAPTKEELDHHYLWRFYKKLPKDGHIAIFDRSWYGRVLVERVEGFANNEAWMRAYKEINDMELHWANHGIIMFKFWVTIDQDEQLRRFEARQLDPAKQHKMTDEDWRNRNKWGEYEDAANDMIMRTSTDYAPWTIVESNDKKFARIKTLELVTNELEKYLK